MSNRISPHFSTVTVSTFIFSEWIFASVDLRQSHVAEYFDLTIDDCFIKSSGDEDKLNIQIIEDGRPVFSFVKVVCTKLSPLYLALENE